LIYKNIKTNTVCLILLRKVLQIYGLGGNLIIKGCGCGGKNEGEKDLDGDLQFK